MTNIIPHIFEDNLVRSIMLDDEPWFIGRDVCHVLAIKNESDAMSRLDDDERAEVAIADPSGSKKAIAVSEPGVFRLIFTSRKPEAERFKRWLAHDVLPKLRREGHYGAAPREPGETVLADEASITSQSIGVLKAKVDLVAECRKLHGHDRARALWRAIGLPMPPIEVQGPIDDARTCLNTILGIQLREGATVAALIAVALDGDVNAQLELRHAGIATVLDPEGFIVANRSAEIERRFAGTPWGNGRWRLMLRRLPGCQSAGARRYDGIQTRGTFVPERYLDRDDERANILET